MKKVLFLMLAVSSLLFSCKKEVVEPAQPKDTVITDTTTVNDTTSTDTTNTDTVGTGDLVIWIENTVPSFGYGVNYGMDFVVISDMGDTVVVDTANPVQESGWLTFVTEVQFTDCDAFELHVFNVWNNAGCCFKVVFDLETELMHRSTPRVEQIEHSINKNNQSTVTFNSECISTNDGG